MQTEGDKLFSHASRLYNMHVRRRDETGLPEREEQAQVAHILSVPLTEPFMQQDHCVMWEIVRSG